MQQPGVQKRSGLHSLGPGGIFITSPGSYWAGQAGPLLLWVHGFFLQSQSARTGLLRTSTFGAATGAPRGAGCRMAKFGRAPHPLKSGRCEPVAPTRTWPRRGVVSDQGACGVCGRLFVIVRFADAVGFWTHRCARVSLIVSQMLSSIVMCWP